MARHLERRVARAAVDRRGCARRGRRRPIGRSPGRHVAPPPAAVPAASRRHPARRGADAPHAFRQEAPRRDRAPHARGRAGGRLRQRAPLQQRDAAHLQAHAERAPASRAAAATARSRLLSLSARLSPTLRLGLRPQLPARPCHAGRRAGGRWGLSPEHPLRRTDGTSRRLARAGAIGARDRGSLSRSSRAPRDCRTRAATCST